MSATMLLETPAHTATGPADVQTAVRIARERGLRLAVRATGHGTLVEPDGDALLVDTSPMTTVAIDPGRRIAHAGPGARWSDVIAAAAPYGLAPLAGSSASVGVAGYTLGGGVGWLSRRFGFAADNLLSAGLVTADGLSRTVSADRDPDLFWAIRGGGGNFGIVTALEFRLHPVPRAYGGKAVFPVDRAADVLAFFSGWAPTQPDELTTSLVVTGSELVVRGFYAGDPAAAARALRPLWWVAGRPVRDEFRPMTYADAGTIGGTPPRTFATFRVAPPVGPVLSVAESAAVEVRFWGGAMARPGGPVGHRDAPFSVTVAGPAEPLLPYSSGGSFLNFLNDTTRTHTAYTTENYRRLRDVKRAYDPDNVFGLSHNIPPR